MKKMLPGFRIIKTVLSVFICLSVGKMVGHGLPFYAVLSCVLMMKENPTLSIEYGIDRSIGTILGGIISLLTLYLVIFFEISPDSWLYILVISMTLLGSLTITHLVGLSEYAMSMTSILILIILLNGQNTVQNALTYTVIRVVETILGIVVAVVVNIFICPVKEN